MRYLSLMESELRVKPQCNDQGIHNYLLYYRLNDSSTIRISHERGFVGTMGTTTWVVRNKFGLVLNKDDEVYSVLHQFDHSKQLKKQMDEEYQIFPKEILRLKH